ncbi:MAG: helix-turn-helix domain-containing protein [Candidatus Woesearchaeota archaeon]
MIMKDDFLVKLRQYFGLNLYEVRIWTALLSRGVSTAGELSDIGNVPRSRAYDVLESLEKKGFVVMKLGKPIKYLAVDPGEVVERVKKFVRIEADVKAKRLDSLRGSDVLNELNTLHTQGIEFVEPSDLSGAIRGRHNLYTHLELMVRNAKKSVTFMTTSKGMIRKVDALKPELEKLSKKGVKIRIAAPITKDNERAVRDVMKFAEVRNNKNVNARFCIIDNKELLFMVLDDEDVHPTYDVGVWVNTPFFASALDNMFDACWKTLGSVEQALKGK